MIKRWPSCETFSS